MAVLYERRQGQFDFWWLARGRLQMYTKETAPSFYAELTFTPEEVERLRVFLNNPPEEAN